MLEAYKLATIVAGQLLGLWPHVLPNVQSSTEGIFKEWSIYISVWPALLVLTGKARPGDPTLFSTQGI